MNTIFHDISPEHLCSALDRFAHIVTIDVKGVIHEANQRFFDLLGFEGSEVLGKNIREFSADGAFSVEFPKQELRFWSKSGFVFWLEVNLAPHEKTQELYLLIGFDITERKSTEQYLADSQLFSKILMQSAPVGLFIANPSGGCTYVNEQWSRASGIPQSKAIGNGWQSALHKSDRTAFLTAWSLFLEGEVPFGEREFRYQKSDGSETWIHASGVALKDADGRVTGYLRTEQDITERIHSEQIILEQQMKMTTTAKLSSLGEMAGGVAHEINNPLATIRSLSAQIQELLDEEPLDLPMIAQRAAKIEATTLRIGKIIQGLRAFSRDGGADPFEPVTLKALIEDTLSFCRERFHSHGVDLAIEPLSGNLVFEARMTEISQVLLNLLNNAYDAVVELPQKWVKISAREEAESIVLCVTDSGNGIPPEVAHKLFHPFFTTKEIGKGTGLGLSVSKGIIERHHGRLEVDSRCKNTTFVVRLPKKQPNGYAKQ